MLNWPPLLAPLSHSLHSATRRTHHLSPISPEASTLVNSLPPLSGRLCSAGAAPPLRFVTGRGSIASPRPPPLYLVRSFLYAPSASLWPQIYTHSLTAMESGFYIFLCGKAAFSTTTAKHHAPHAALSLCVAQLFRGMPCRVFAAPRPPPLYLVRSFLYAPSASLWPQIYTHSLTAMESGFYISCAAKPHFPPQRQNTLHRMPLFRFALRRSFVACRAGCLPHPDRHPSVWLGHFFMRPPLRYGRKFTPTALRPWKAVFTFLYAVSASL